MYVLTRNRRAFSDTSGCMQSPTWRRTDGGRSGKLRWMTEDVRTGTQKRLSYGSVNAYLDNRLYTTGAINYVNILSRK